jgi:hypothetical protein
MWVDQHAVKVPGGRAVVEAEADVIYLAAALRNAGSGLAVLHGWHAWAGFRPATEPPAPPEQFRRLTRDLYIPAGDTGFWQGAVREVDDDDRAMLLGALEERQILTVDLLYGDQEGGQRTITRFSLTPVDDGWLCSAARHWNLDRADPR